MKKAKGEGEVLGVLRLLRTIPKTFEDEQKRMAEISRQEKLLSEAASQVFKVASKQPEYEQLQGRLSWALDRHLNRLEEEARQGKYREVSLALRGIGGAAARLLGMFRRAPIGALDRLRVVPEGEIYPVVEWEAAGGHDLPVSENREVYEGAESDSSKDPSPLLRRLAALEHLASMAAEQAEAESKTEDAVGAKSVWQARSGRTPDMELFEDCVRILGPLPNGLARFGAIAKLIQEAATGETPSVSWGRDHEVRARKWWRKVKPWIGVPLGRLSEEHRDLVESGLISIPARRKRGQKSKGGMRRSSAPKSKAGTASRPK